MTDESCPSCGRTLDEHDRHIRFGVPEPVLSIPEAERIGLTWGNDRLMRVEGLGGFIRILIPIRLTGGYLVTYGAWLSVESADLRRAWEVWDDPAYAELRIGGVLANMLPGWEKETYTKPLETAVRDVDHVPYAVASSDAFMSRLIKEEWSHEVVLAAIASYDL